MKQLIALNQFVFLAEGEQSINADQIPDDLNPIIDLFIKDNDGKPLS